MKISINVPLSGSLIHTHTPAGKAQNLYGIMFIVQQIGMSSLKQLDLRYGNMESAFHGFTTFPYILL